MVETYWAIRHTGGCSGKLHGYTICMDEAMAKVKLTRCTDPACKIVKVRIEEVV